MTYSFNISVSAEISPAVVQEIVTRAIEEQTGKKVASITEKSDQGKGSETVFGGYYVTFKEDTKSTTKVLQKSKGFVPTTYE